MTSWLYYYLVLGLAVPNICHCYSVSDSTLIVESDIGKKYVIDTQGDEPRAFLVEDFLTYEECDHIISLGKDNLVASRVVNSTSGEHMDSGHRTSHGAALRTAQDDVILRIERRIAQLTMIPRENQEAMQLLRYENGQHYKAHHDYFYDSVNPAWEKGGQRLVTVLMYLSNVEEGGETSFPYASPKSTGPEFSECAKQGLAVKPLKGAVLLFWNLKPSLEVDEASLHESCPTLKGTKYTATKWIRFGMHDFSVRRELSACVNLHDDKSCNYWAGVGECDKRPQFMHYRCAYACKACQRQRQPPSQPEVAQGTPNLEELPKVEVAR